MVTISKKQVSKTSIFELPGLKNCISRLCTRPFTRPLLVEIAISRLLARVVNGPKQGPQSGYHGVTEVAKTANIAKNGWKVHKLHKRSSHSAPYKPHRVGTRKHFFGSKSKKPKDSIAFGKSTSQRIYSEQHVPKIGWKPDEYGLKHALHTLEGHFR